MALTLSSPCGFYDEDEEMAVFESTAAELGGPARLRPPELSVISPGLESRPSVVEPVREQIMRFYLQPCDLDNHEECNVSAKLHSFVHH